jgi:hypothetical protein
MQRMTDSFVSQIAVSKSPEVEKHDMSSLRWFMTGAA